RLRRHSFPNDALPILESEALTFQVRLARNYQTAEDFRRLVIFEGEDGHLVRLGEVADVEVGPRETKRMFRTNGATTTGFGIVKRSEEHTSELQSRENL